MNALSEGNVTAELEQRAKQAREALDAHVREVVGWHFDPDGGTPFGQLRYQPMLELIDELRTRGFDVSLAVARVGAPDGSAGVSSSGTFSPMFAACCEALSIRLHTNWPVRRRILRSLPRTSARSLYSSAMMC